MLAALLLLLPSQLLFLLLPTLAPLLLLPTLLLPLLLLLLMPTQLLLLPQPLLPLMLLLPLVQELFRKKAAARQLGQQPKISALITWGGTFVIASKALDTREAWIQR